MSGFFRNILFKIQRIMYGRYGLDELSRASVITAFGCFLLSFLPFCGFLYAPAVFLVIWAYIRCFSRNINARRKELGVYLKFKGKFRERAGLRKKIWWERNTYRYFKCKGCGAYWRVPKGKGRVEITCRVCKAVMTKKA